MIHKCMGGDGTCQMYWDTTSAGAIAAPLARDGRYYCRNHGAERSRASAPPPCGIVARVIQVVEVQVARGEGVVGDPCRIVHQYWAVSEEARLLAEHDPLPDIIRDMETAR
jgi:hypothetical protein